MTFTAITPPPRVRLSDIVYEQLEKMIVEGTLTPGANLPSERELAEQLKVSRPPVREALHKLASRGLISQRNSGGYCVANASAPLIANPLAELLARHPKAAGDILELRQGLESVSVQLAAARANDADLARLEQVTEELEQSFQQRDDPAALAALPLLDARFHMHLAEATHNIALVHVMQAIFNLIHSAVEQNYRQLWEQGSSCEDLIRQHRAILTAVRARDADAGLAAVNHHLEYIRDNLSERLD